MIYILSALAIVSSCLYWLYKKFRGPMYQPGMVATASSKDSFDDPSLYSQTTDSKWILPGGIELFYFNPGESASGGGADDNPKQRRPILCLHGGPSIAPSQPWKLCEHVPDVYLYHSRGCGQSTRPLVEFPSKSMFPGMKILEAALGLGAQVADVERIRNRLGVPKLDLVGHSFGGLIATLYASEFPQHVRSLTLLAPASVLILPPPKGVPDFFQIMGDRIRAQNQYENSEQRVAEYEAFHKRYFDFSNFPDETEATLQQRQMEFVIQYARAEETEEKGPSTESATIPREMFGGFASYAQFLSMGMEHNYIPICKKLLANHANEIPVAIVHGADDMVPEIASRQYQDVFPKASFDVIQGEGHFLFNHPRVVEIVKANMEKANE